MNIQLLTNLSNNSFRKIINNFYVMATNMKKKLFSLKPSALLKVIMKMTSPTSDGGPTSILGCTNVLTNHLAYANLKDKHAKLKKKQLQNANMVREGNDEKPKKRNKLQNQL